MLDEALDFVRFLKTQRFSAPHADLEGTDDNTIGAIFAAPRSISVLADEQRAFVASLSPPLVDVDLPSEE